MKLREAAIGNLARMICGDKPYNGIFPYRSGSELTEFFHSLNLDYTHDGSTRYYWVTWCLNELNIDGPNLSENLMRVILNIVHPDYFIHSDINHAIEELNKILNHYELKVVLVTGKPQLQIAEETFVTTAQIKTQAQKVITFSPVAFEVPSEPPDERLVSVMMPFSKDFDGVYNAIQQACRRENLKCFRADDLWLSSTIVQDIFTLIYCSKIVIVDFTGRNPNVMYETGIAHTLGKIVIPITQSLEDIPFDLRAHRTLRYLSNSQGLNDLENELCSKLTSVIHGHSW